MLSCWLCCFCSPCGQKSSSAWVYIIPCVVVTVWLQHREQHSYNHTVINYFVRSTYTHAEEDFWPQGLQKQWSQQPNTYVKRKPVTEGLSVHLKYKNSYKREVLPDNTIQQLQRETIWYHTTPTKQQNRRTPASPIDIQQPTASKAMTRPTSETDEQQSTVKDEFYII